jgi:hypothetical protein
MTIDVATRKKGEGFLAGSFFYGGLRGCLNITYSTQFKVLSEEFNPLFFFLSPSS